MKDKLAYFVIFTPVILVFLVMWVDSKFGIDRIETEESAEKDKPWLNQKITIGRNPHVEYPTHSSKSKRWKILLVWLVPCLILFLIKVFE